MIFFDSSLEIDLIDYGIDIPIIKRGSLIQKILGEDQVKDLRFKEVESLEPHSQDYIQKLCNDKDLAKEVEKTFELVDEDGSLRRYYPQKAEKSLDHLGRVLLRRVSGTILSAEYALENGFAFYLGGGMHHALSGRGSGFCLIHDVIISANRYPDKKIGIIDLDVHKGDGTAVMAKSMEHIFCLSIHMANGWPLDDPSRKASFTPSDYDIPIEEGDEHLYLEKLEKGLRDLPYFDLVYILAGTDPYEKDQLPSSSLINLTLKQMLKRDELVYSFFKERETPQAWVLSGGYGDYSVEPTVAFIRSIDQN